MKLALISALAGTAAAAVYSPGATGLRTYAPGVNPPAHQRPVAEGEDPQKIVWAYTGAVTQGDADGYAPLCARFQPKFVALQENLEDIVKRLQALGQPMLASMVGKMAAAAPHRLSDKLEEQVLRQRLSVCELESDERPALKEQLQSVQAKLQAQDASVEETLEELRAELADLDED